jgi:hypothetical protein
MLRWRRERGLTPYHPLSDQRLLLEQRHLPGLPASVSRSARPATSTCGSCMKRSVAVDWVTARASATRCCALRSRGVSVAQFFHSRCPAREATELIAKHIDDGLARCRTPERSRTGGSKLIRDVKADPSGTTEGSRARSWCGRLTTTTALLASALRSSAYGQSCVPPPEALRDFFLLACAPAAPSATRLERRTRASHGPDSSSPWE